MYKCYLDSPCIGICEIGDNRLCKGCYRRLDEIIKWTQLNDADRYKVLNNVELRKLNRKCE